MIEKVIAEKSRQYSERVIELISEHREFTTTRLVEQIDSYSPCRMVGDMFLLQIQRLKKQHREGYALSHQETHHSLLKFNGHLNIYFSDIDTAWLKRYESWLRGQEFSENTIGRRFRTLRLYIMSLLRERLPSRNTTLSSLIKCRNCTERPLNVLSAKRKYFGSSTMPAIVLMSDWPSICSLSAIIWGESIS